MKQSWLTEETDPFCMDQAMTAYRRHGAPDRSATAVAATRVFLLSRRPGASS